MYTIKAAAEMTGVAGATLRAWERRYGVVSPERTDGGYRVYTDDDLDAIRAMVALIERGYAPRQAAGQVRDHGLPRPAAPSSHLPRDVPENAHPPRDVPENAHPPRDVPENAHLPRDVPENVHPPRDVPENAHLPREVRREEATESLVAAAAAIDAAEVSRVLDEQFATGSFEHVVDRWLMPALGEIGAAWASGRVSIAGEHLVAHAVHRRLAAFFDAARAGSGSARVVVGLPGGVHHELGLLAFSVALRRAGLDVIHLGSDVPEGAWRAALDAHDAVAAVTAAPMRADASAATSLVAGLARSHPRVTLVVGGEHQDEVTGQGVLRPGHAMQSAATEVAELIGRGP